MGQLPHSVPTSAKWSGDAAITRVEPGSTKVARVSTTANAVVGEDGAVSRTNIVGEDAKWAGRGAMGILTCL